MIPHSLHNNEYFWSYDEKYDIFSYYFSLCFSSFNRKYLKLIKMDISVFEFKLFKYLFITLFSHKDIYIFIFMLLYSCMKTRSYVIFKNMFLYILLSPGW